MALDWLALTGWPARCLGFRRADLVERLIFAMVANRLSVKPLSELAGCTLVAHRAFIDCDPPVTFTP